MSRLWYSWYSCLLLLCSSGSSAIADEPALSLSRVVELARTRAPDAVVARARVEERRAGLVGARRLSTRNPVLETDVGPRWSDGRSTDVQSSLSIPLDLGGRRSTRIATANAEIEHDQLDARHVEQLAIATATVAYYEVLHAGRRVVLAEERVALAEAAQTTAQQRARAGDVAEFEVNLARGEVARAKSGVVSARGEQSRARAQLAAALGLTDVPTVIGDLADRKAFEGGTTLVRTDLRVLEREIDVARADAAAARAERWPALDLRVSYEHERDADVVLAGIAIALPIFDRGQGDAARADARARRARTELAVRTSLVSSQVARARDTYQTMIDAVQILERDALPLSLENETAAAASYRAGKIDLGALLTIRREVLDTRREHLDRLLDAAVAAIDLWIARGAPPIP